MQNIKKNVWKQPSNNMVLADNNVVVIPKREVTI